MKKSALVLVLLLTVALISAAVAQEEETDETDDTTLSEVSTMNTPPGAEVRLLQLEKAITRNILAGNEVIAQIQEEGNDTSELEAIITELEALKLEVQSLDPSSETAVEDFVNIKQEAIELSKEFRDTARQYFVTGDRLALAQRIRSMNTTGLMEYNNRIRAQIHALNADIAAKVFESLIIENEELIQKIQNGEATFDEIKDAVKAAIQNMSQEERKAAWSNLKESGVRKDVAARARIEKARLKVNERKATRLEWMTKATDKIQDANKKARIQAALNVRAQLVDNRITRIENRLDKVQAIRQNIKDRIAGGGQE